MDGVINVFKPRGMTSHDVVYLIRKILNIKKVGHTGTLDPNATGVLPICIGKGTRISEYLLDVDKEYVGELTLGIATDTQDDSGNIIHTSDNIVNEDEIVNSFNKFKGNILQTPPMYSALKHKGKKLYELAREGIFVERKSREVSIKDLKILNNYNNKEILFYTRCSRGTYIRTLCDDIGKDLNIYGHMSYLIRVGVGSFKIEDAYSIDYLQELPKDEVIKLVVPMDEALDYMDKIMIDDELYNKIINGVSIILPNDYNNKINVLHKIYSCEKFIGIGKVILTKENKLYLKMDKVLI